MHADDPNAACRPDPVTSAAATAGKEEKPAKTERVRAPAPLATPARAAIEQVMKQPEFGFYHEVEHWRARTQPKPDDSARRPSWLEKFGKVLALIAQNLSWLALGALVLVLIAAIARRMRDLGGAAPGEELPPALLFGLKIAPESLPDDIGAAALALLDQGKVREALSLIYRGALSVLVHDHGLRVPPGDTEGEVIAKAACLLLPPGAAYLRALVAQWVAVAYAARVPDGAEVRALALAYAEHFGRRRPAPQPSTALGASA